jgi:DNA-directed RNA polymerase subunit RPC12/RpoP
MHERALRLIDLIISEALDEIRPSFDPLRGYEYCLRGECEGVGEALEYLYERGYLRKELHDRVASCPNCGSEVFLLRAKCPYCGSLNFSKGIVIEHLSCGYSGLEEEFMSPDGRRICPKCGKELKAPGVDYIRVADIYRCASCKEAFSVPLYSYRCLNCGHEGSTIELVPKEVYKYLVVREAFERDPISRKILDIVRKLADIGYRVEGPRAKVKGRSGAEYDFTIAVWLEGSDEPIAVLDFVRGPIDDERLLSFFAKSLDVMAKERILVTQEKDSLMEAKASRLGIRVFELEDEDLVGKIGEVLLSLHVKGSET